LSEKPILFSADMVQALLNTKPGVWPAEPIDPERPFKWMTRRVVSEKTNEIVEHRLEVYPEVGTEKDFYLHFAPYRIGDTLWVREQARIKDWYTGANGEVCAAVVYNADGQETRMLAPDRIIKKPWFALRKATPRGCFREASRITLKVKGVRIERLQDITEEDARAEGLGSEWLKNWSESLW